MDPHIKREPGYFVHDEAQAAGCSIRLAIATKHDNMVVTDITSRIRIATHMKAIAGQVFDNTPFDP